MKTAPFRENNVKFRVIDGFDALDELEVIKVDAKYRPVVEQRFDIFSNKQPIIIYRSLSERTISIASFYNGNYKFEYTGDQ